MILNFLKTYRVNGSIMATNFEQKVKDGRKIHTIRQDSSRRWKAGMKIHFSTGSRTKYYNCFKEGICKNLQDITIDNRSIVVDGYQLDEYDIEALAINDGFDSIKDFWGWFDKYDLFCGRIIHWTKMHYQHPDCECSIGMPNPGCAAGANCSWDI